MSVGAVTDFARECGFQLDDLESLRQVVGGARVVGIGESAHAVREFGEIRLRLVRFLVEEMGFSEVCFESGLVESDIVDRYVRGEAATVDQLIGGFTYNFGRLQDVQELVAWLRRHNETAGRKVGFHGTDVPGSLRTPLPGIEYTISHAAELGLESELPQLESAAEAYRAITCDWERFDFSAVPPETQIAARELFARCAAASGSREVLATLRGIEIGLEMVDDQLPPDSGTRDHNMAETALWLLGRQPVGRGLIVLEHNAHLQREPMRLWETEMPVHDSMGQHLAAALGEGFCMIGFTFGEGPGAGPADPESVDGALSAAGRDGLVLDLRRSEGPARDWLEGLRKHRLNDLYTAIHPLPAYDAVIHVESVTPSIWLPEPVAG